MLFPDSVIKLWILLLSVLDQLWILEETYFRKSKEQSFQDFQELNTVKALLATTLVSDQV